MKRAWAARVLVLALIVAARPAVLSADAWRPAPLPAVYLASGETLDAEVEVAGALWLQLRFKFFRLGKASSITLTSAQDGSEQRLDARAMKIWRNHSAFFNGDKVAIRLHVAREDSGQLIFVAVDDVIAGTEVARVLAPGGFFIDSHCDGESSRVPSADPRSGRIMPYECSGWLIASGAVLTVGHCKPEFVQIMEFNVPRSGCDGALRHPPVEDQYPVRAGTIRSRFNGTGDDWMIFGLHRNTDTGRTALERQGEFFRVTDDPRLLYRGRTLRVTGYGIEGEPPGCTGQLNSRSQTQQTATGPFVEIERRSETDVTLFYRVDTEGGSSGSAVATASGELAFGIHGDGGCDSLGGNRGTGFENVDLARVVRTFHNRAVIYVDARSPVADEDGSIFRPLRNLAEAIGEARPGDRLRVLDGRYWLPGNRLGGKKLTLTAPGGGVVIGPSRQSRH